MTRNLNYAAAALLIAVLLCIGLFAGRFVTYLTMRIMILAIFAMGYNILLGRTGLLSFGHAALFASGSYGLGLFYLHVSRHPLLAIAAGVLAAAVMALIIGFFCVRHTEIYFAMLTLAFGMLAHSILFKFYYLTGGDSGMRVPRMRILGLEFAAYNKIELLAGPFYYYCLALLVLAGLLMWRIVHSPFGLHLRSLRDNPQKALYLGVRVRQFRLAAFVISAVYGAIGGAILGFRIGLADPELVHWTHSGHLVFMTVLGGFTSFLGPIAGALALTLLQDQLQSITQYWRFVLGAILAAMVIFFPRGLAGIASDAARAARQSAFGATRKGRAA